MIFEKRKKHTRTRGAVFEFPPRGGNCSVKTRARGAVLLEILLALLVLSISLGLIIQAITSSLRAADYSADLLKATFLLETKMCDLAKGKFITRGLSLQEQAAEPFEDYDYQITARDGSPAKNIQQVDLRVSWGSGQKKNDLTASTFLFASRD